MARPSHRPRQQLHNAPLQVVVRGNANGVLHAPLFQSLVDLRFGKRRVRPESNLLALRLLTLDLRQQKLIPAFGAVHIARTQLRRQAVAVTIEQKQRMVADRLKVPVVGAALLLTMNRTLAGVHVEHDAIGAVETFGLPKRLPVQRHQPDQILFLGQQLSLEPVQGRGQRRATVPDPLRTDQSERRIGCESFSVIEVLVARQAAVNRLPQ